MKLLVRRREVAVAERRLQRERADWHAQTTALRACAARHRGALAVGTGAIGGLLCGLLPLRSIARLGRFLASAAEFALRTPIGAMLIDGMKRHAPAQTASPTDDIR